MAKIYRLDSKGIPFEFESYFLEPREYAKIISEINTNYGRYIGKVVAVHYSHEPEYEAYKYYFENHGYNDYNIISKQLIF